MALPSQPSPTAPSSEWLVYADALQQARDPRGELIAFTVAGKNPDAFVREHADELLGEAGKHLSNYRLKWKLCFVDEAEVVLQQTSGADDAVRSLLKSPAAAVLSSLAIVGLAEGAETIDLTAAVAAAVEALPASCRALSLVDERATKVSTLVSRDFDPGENLVNFGPLEAIWSLPGVERLTISVADPMQLELGQIAAPNLKSFTLNDLRLGDTYGPQPDVVRALAAADFPKLESFELRLVEQWVANVPDDSDAYTPLGGEGSSYDDGPDDGDNEGTNWTEQLGDLLPRLKALPLKRLALTSFESGRSLLEALQTAGLPPTLEELDLSDSSFSSDEATWLVKNGSLVKGLKRLVLRGTVLEAGDVKALSALGPKVEYTPGDGAKYRYVVGME